MVDHGDQCLSEHHREKHARHSMRLEAHDDGTDASDSEQPIIHHVGVVIDGPNDANGTVSPEEEECCRERKTDGGSLQL